MKTKKLIFSTLFLMTTLFMSTGNQAQAMDQNEQAVYKAIKTNFFITADKLNLNSRQTWTGPKLWDTYKNIIQNILETPNLTTNQIFDKLTNVFKDDMQLGYNGANFIMRNAKHNGILSANDPALFNLKTNQTRTQSDIYTLLDNLTALRHQPASRATSSTSSQSHMTTDINAVYDALKTNFFIASDKNNWGTQGQHAWDAAKAQVRNLLQTPNLTVDQIWAGLTQIFPTDTNAILGNSKKHGLLPANDPSLKGRTQTNIYDALRAFVNAQGNAPSASSSSTSSAAPAGALPNYLYSAAAIQTAVTSPGRGKGMIIPYFGYYRPADIRAQKNSNGFWYLSNYFVSDPAKHMNVAVSFTYKGQNYTFNNVEAAYQAGKCLIAGIQLTPVQIQQFVKATPDESKTLANTTHAYKYNPRDQQRIDALMTSLVRQKFINGALGAKLDTETGETELVEGNAWDDAIWGKPFDGIRHVPAQKGPMAGQQGQNKLGKMLVDIRADIRNGLKRGSIPAFAI